LKRREVKLLYLMASLSGLARGAYLVCIGWTTLVLSNNVATVGQIFIVSSVTLVLAGPIVGVIIDRYKRKKLIILAQFLIAVSILGFGGFLFYSPDLSVLWLFGIVAIVTVLRIMYFGAFDGILRASVENSEILQTVARTNAIHLFSAAAGTAAVGLIIDRFSAAHGFLATAAASIGLVIVAGFIADGFVKTNARGMSGFWFDLRSGFEIFRNNKFIQSIVLLSVVALPIGQLSNALLSSFIRDDLGEGSDLFGFVDATWPIGGMLAAALLSNQLKKLNAKNIEYFLAVMAGVSTIILSYGTASLGLAIAHGFMGFFVWSCRIVTGARILALCRNENVGRTRVYIEAMVSVSAMVMCLSPTLVVLEATASYFLYWGLFVVAGAILLWVWKNRQTA
jgi:MFS family permease